MVYKLSGIFSLVSGILAALTCFFPAVLPIGMILSISGFVFSIFRIFQKTKYFPNKAGFDLAYLGMILSSAPVIYILLIIFVFNHK